jgi:hypothetical protein
MLSLLLMLGGSADAPQGPFLGQPPPGAQPVPFAPGLLNTGLATRDLAMNAEGTEFYFTVFLPGFRKAAICWIHREGAGWSRPEVAPFARDPRWKTLEPCLSPDGRKLFFASDRPAAGADKPGPFGIWVAERQGQGWSEPVRLGAEVNGAANVFYPSVTRGGDLYFLQEEGQGGWILRSRWKNGRFQAAERLPEPFNRSPKQANPRIDPDERFLVLPMFGQPDGLGGGDYYAHFRRKDGTWTEAQSLGAPINSSATDEFSLSLSPDGKVIFFGSNRALDRLDHGPLTFEALLAERTQPGNGQNTVWWVDAGNFWLLRDRALAPVHPTPKR